MRIDGSRLGIGDNSCEIVEDFKDVSGRWQNPVGGLGLRRGLMRNDACCGARRRSKRDVTVRSVSIDYSIINFGGIGACWGDRVGTGMM